MPDYIAFKSVALIKNPALGEGLPDRVFFQRKAKHSTIIGHVCHFRFLPSDLIRRYLWPIKRSTF